MDVSGYYDVMDGSGFDYYGAMGGYEYGYGSVYYDVKGGHGSD